MKRQSVIEYLNMMNYLYSLIQQERSGNAKELAYRLDISERSVYQRLSDLKDLGAIIEYDNKHHTYFFKNKFIMKSIFEVSVKD